MGERARGNEAAVGRAYHHAYETFALGRPRLSRFGLARPAVPRPTLSSRALSRIAPILNAMADEVFLQMKHYLSFTAEDAANLHALAEPLAPCLPRVANRFYEVIRGHPDARRVFTGGDEQIARQHKMLEAWLRGLFEGTYDENHFKNSSRVGRIHVEVRLPQHYMIISMEVVRAELERYLRGLNLPDERAKLASVQKLLALELGAMLEAYRAHYAALIRTRERKAMEEQLTKAEHMAQLGRLAASLAHAIKNPLAGISGAIQVIRGTFPKDTPHREIIDEMLAQIDRLDATVRDLLGYARPRALDRTSVELNELIARVLNILREEPKLRRIRVKHQREGTLPRIMADERQLEQVVMNLLLNAADASNEGDRITITTTCESGGIRMEIQDEGLGMEPDVLARAFEPFYTTKTRGTGLGLPICQQIVDAHNGRMDIESTKHLGTKVVIELPFDQNDVDHRLNTVQG